MQPHAKGNGHLSHAAIKAAALLSCLAAWQHPGRSCFSSWRISTGCCAVSCLRGGGKTVHVQGGWGHFYILCFWYLFNRWPVLAYCTFQVLLTGCRLENRLWCSVAIHENHSIYLIVISWQCQTTAYTQVQCCATYHSSVNVPSHVLSLQQWHTSPSGIRGGGGTWGHPTWNHTHRLCGARHRPEDGPGPHH